MVGDWEGEKKMGEAGEQNMTRLFLGENRTRRGGAGIKIGEDDEVKG